VTRHLQPVAYLFATLVLSGCAAGHGGSLTSRFIRPGTPTMNYGGKQAVPKESLSDYMEKIRHLSARPARQGTFGATVENTDPRLAAAILATNILPTAENQLRIAREYRRLGLLDSAYARVNRAIQLDARSSEAHEEMARIWRDWRLPDLALGSAYRAVYNDPLSASARNTLGTILDALGRTEDARRAYERATTIDARAAWAFNNLCYSDFRSGRLKEARAQCHEALRLDPALAAAHNNMALTYAAEGDLDRARLEFLAAGDLASAQYNLGIVHLADRDYAAAATAFEQAIQARASFTAAKERAHDARMRTLTGTE
jgi:tetratricopeptide (TPR) repeat protein